MMKQMILLGMIVVVLAIPTASAFAQAPNGDDFDSLGCDTDVFWFHMVYFLENMTTLEDAFAMMSLAFGTIVDCWDDWLMMLLDPSPPPDTEDIYPLF